MTDKQIVNYIYDLIIHNIDPKNRTDTERTIVNLIKKERQNRTITILK